MIALLPASGFLKKCGFPALAVLALALGGCKNLSDVTGSIGNLGASRTLPASQEGLRAYSESWGKRFEANPADKDAAITYARALKALTLYHQASAVLQTAVLRHPDDKELLAAYGKALVDEGRLAEAEPVLANASTPERPNWSVMSTQGQVADQLGDHPRAQAFYTEALKIEPGEPRVLSNLGLSYALAKDLPRAESTLRTAAADPRADQRVRENFALVLALQGKFAEAEDIFRRDGPADQAKSNVTAIRSMIAQSNTWRDIQKLDAGKKPDGKKG